jgi:hypothetical protein
MMEGERKRSKGGLFNLFDWNGKSRKKLFANNSELPGIVVVLKIMAVRIVISDCFLSCPVFNLIYVCMCCDCRRIKARKRKC